MRINFIISIQEKLFYQKMGLENKTRSHGFAASLGTEHIFHE